MFVKWIFDYMRVGEGVGTSKNIVVKFGDREDAVGLVSTVQLRDILQGKIVTYLI
jgi:hypothetical protein